MLPILLRIGPITIYSFGVCLFFGLLFGLYTWWKLGRDEHWEEISLFDAFFLSLFVFFIAGRIGYVALHWAEMHVLWRAVGVLSYPGLSYPVGIGGVGAFLAFFSHEQGWNVRKVWDGAVVALSMTLIFTAVGGLLSGASVGIPWHWGIVTQMDGVRRFPADVWSVVWAILTYAVVFAVRKNFRFYAWYRGQATVAKNGLAALVFVAFAGLFYGVAGWITVQSTRLGPIPVTSVVGAGLIIAAVVGIFLQRGGSGRTTNGLLQWKRT